MTRVEWLEYPKSVTLYLPDKPSQILKVGDFITYEERKGTGVIIVKFYGYKDETGPRVFSYLPWRDEPSRDTGQWATPKFCLKGDVRSIICYPCGSRHSGEHIMWNKLENINHLAPLHDDFQSKQNLLST
jgi:hypothetical protein